jgi:cyclophilin family peptidyl-prolyl cis-trans isomerase
VEFLEARENPTVNVLSIGAQEMASDRAFFLPISVTNSPSGPVQHTVTTNNANLSAQVLTGRSVSFTVTNGAGLSGTFRVQLFDDVAPLASQRIVDLVTSGYYTNKQFFRIEDLFSTTSETNVIIQGGGLNSSDNSTRADLEGEFNKDYTFASNGLVALAKTSNPISSNSQFFLTDLDRPLNERVEFLNYHYTIFGILTSGFDVFTAMKNAPKSGTAPNPPITITGASLTSDVDDPNAVIKFTPTGTGFLGTTSVTVNSADIDGTTPTTFNLTGKTDTNTSNPPILLPVPDTIMATSGQATTLTVTPFDKEGNPVSYVIRDATFGGPPANLSFSISQQTGIITLTPASNFTGTTKFTIGVRDASAADTNSNYGAQLVTMTVNAPTSPPTSPPPPATDTFTVTGSTAGNEPRIIATNSNGSQRFSVLAFEAGFSGGVRTAVADVNGDGKLDVVVVPAFGGASVVRVLDGTDGHVIYSKLVFEETFRGGLFLDVGDARNLGYSQVLVGAGQDGGPRVTLLDVKQNQVLLNYFAADQATRGGISVDIGEIVTGRGPMIVTGGGAGNGPVVNVYAPADGRLLGSFIAGNADDRRGIQVKIGETVNSSFSAHPILVAPVTSTLQSDFKEYNAVPFLSLT